MMHLYSAFIVYCHTPKALYNHVGGVSVGHIYTRSPLHLSARRESNECRNGTGDEELQENISELRSDEMLSGHMSVKMSFPVLSVVILGL